MLKKDNMFFPILFVAYILQGILTLLVWSNTNIVWSINTDAVSDPEDKDLLRMIDKSDHQSEKVNNKKQAQFFLFKRLKWTYEL